MKHRYFQLVIGLIALSMTACSSAGSDAEYGGFNNGSSGEFDTGGNNGSDDDDFVPEEETDFEFSAPAVVGEKVYVANETLNSVAVIDSRNLSISTRLVGFRPTQVVGPDAERVEPGDDANVMVLNEGSRSVSIMATDSEQVTSVKVMAQANAIAMDPTGNASVVWYDPENAKATDPAGDLSSVSVVQDGTSYEISVGFHVRDVFFDDAGEVALVLTDDGISSIDLTELSGDAIAPPTPIVPPTYQTSQPEDLEVLVSSDANWAVTRSAGFEGAVLLEVDTGKHHFLPLPEIPTDIDLIDPNSNEPDTTDDTLEVLIMLRNQGKAVRATIPDGFRAAADAMEPAPVVPMSSHDAGMDAGSDAGSDAGMDVGSDTGMDAGDDTGSQDTDIQDTGSQDTGSQDDPFTFPSGITGFEVIDVQAPGMGAASVSLDGQTALLFTTLDQETRAVLLDLAAAADEAQRTIVFEKGVRGALSDRNGQTFLVFHSKVDGPIPPDATPADPEYIARSWGVSAVDVDSAASRLVLTKHEPGQASLWTPADETQEEGDAKVFLIFKTPETNAGVQPSHRDVLTINLRSFRTDSFRVPSLPEGLGPIRSARRIYISQRHPQGRMTFVDVDSGARQTITGYQLNAGID